MFEELFQQDLQVTLMTLALCAVSVAVGLVGMLASRRRDVMAASPPQPTPPVVVAASEATMAAAHQARADFLARVTPAPEREAVLECVPAAVPTPQTAPPEPAPDGRFKILVVDDNAINRQVLELILDSVGLEHDSVENGLESVEAMKTGGYDAVLMDIQMPVMDGLQATREIRTWEAGHGRARAPIVIVSANCLKEHVEAGRAAGADAHLHKPISAAALIGVLSAYAEEAEQVAA